MRFFAAQCAASRKKLQFFVLNYFHFCLFVCCFLLHIKQEKANLD